jgi:2-polyprenyl-6-methoxyphenol hydroxylase-like FAD-dependent oxidoreductase
MTDVDVVVVGAGIAGGALGSRLARAGLSVLILERTTEYVDRVRGEWMAPWGVADAIANGVHDALVAAGAGLNSRYIPYDEVTTPAEAEAATASIANLLPGVAGALTLGHPVACRALDELAARDGATVLHGVEVGEVVAGASPAVTYIADGETHTTTCRLVVGADGRESVVRRSLGVELERTEPRCHMGGLLIEGLRDWPMNDFLIGTEGDRILLAFPQIDGRARLYLGFRSDDKGRLAGSDKTAAFLRDFDCTMIPDSERFSGATPAGPCAAFPMFDSWTDTPAAQGAVLIGDAAGFSNPLIGQGLSVAMRDVRLVGDALIGSDDWSTETFAPYASERAERMRRLRVAVEIFTDARMPLGRDGLDERRRRMALCGGEDAELFMTQAIAMVGPELMPANAFEPEVRDRLLLTGAHGG